ncbi:hypothetical protein M422DRAFT_40017, partial [Sphaerobolus stellatus SS14]
IKVAVEGNWGGPASAQKRTWLASAIVDAFEEAQTNSQPLPDATYVEEMLLQVMAYELDTVVENGNAYGVGASIVKLWQEIMQEGRTNGLAKLEELVEKTKGRKVLIDEQVVSDDEFQWEDDEDDDESGEDEDEAHQLQSKKKEEAEVDEDGFTVVKGRNKSHS